MTIRRKRSRTEVRGRTTRACATRGARATGSGITAKLADRTRSTRVRGQASHAQPSANRTVVRRRRRRAPRPTATAMSSRTRMWSIWLCGRCAGHVAPEHGAPPAGQHGHHARAPRSCSRRRRRPVVPAPAVAVAARRRWRSGASRPQHRRRVHGDDVDLVPSHVDRAQQRRTRTVRIGADHADRQVARARRSGSREQIAISTCPSPGSA